MGASQGCQSRDAGSRIESHSTAGEAQSHRPAAEVVRPSQGEIPYGGTSLASPDTRAKAAQPLQKAEADSPTDQQLRKLAIGTWEDDYQGHRTLVLRDDGSATMICELSGVNALFAKRLEFEIQWSVEDGRLTKHTTGGKPAAKVNVILKTMGDRVSEEIVELTGERMVLLDENNQTTYHWRRVGASESSGSRRSAPDP